MSLTKSRVAFKGGLAFLLEKIRLVFDLLLRSFNLYLEGITTEYPLKICMPCSCQSSLVLPGA
jgi:hypothetical protein